jgi:hypothetical protein
MTMRRPWVGMASFVAVLLVLAFGHRWSATASWFTSDKTCHERHATPWFVERLYVDCDRLLRARLWKLYDEGRLFGRLRVRTPARRSGSFGAPRRLAIRNRVRRHRAGAMLDAASKKSPGFSLPGLQSAHLKVTSKGPFP